MNSMRKTAAAVRFKGGGAMRRFFLFMYFLVSLHCGPDSNDLFSREGARERLQSVTIDKMSRSGALIKEAIALYSKKRNKPALRKFREGLLLFPQGEGYFYFGNTLMNVGRYRDASRAFLIALDGILKNRKLAYYNLACAYSHLQRAAASFRALRDAVDAGYMHIHWMARDPDLKWLRKQRGWKNWYTAAVKKYREYKSMEAFRNRPVPAPYLPLYTAGYKGSVPRAGAGPGFIVIYKKGKSSFSFAGGVITGLGGIEPKPDGYVLGRPFYLRPGKVAAFWMKEGAYLLSWRNSDLNRRQVIRILRSVRKTGQ